MDPLKKKLIFKQYKFKYIAFIFLLVTQFFQSCNADEWKLINYFLIDPNQSKTVEISNNNIPFDFQVRVNNKVISTHSSLNILGANEYVHFEKKPKRIKYDLFIKPIYNTSYHFDFDYSVKGSSSIQDDKHYRYLHKLSQTLFKLGNKIALDDLGEFFKKHPSLKLKYNEISRRYCWLLFESQNYQLLLNTLNNLESNNNLYEEKHSEFTFLKAISLLNLGSYDESIEIFKKLLISDNSIMEKQLIKRIQNEEIRALYGFTSSLNLFFQNQDVLTSGNQIKLALNASKKLGNFQIVSKILYLLSSFNTLQKEYQQSINNLEEAQKYLSLANSKQGFFSIYNQFAVNYIFMKQLDKALRFYRLALTNINQSIQPYSKAVLFLNLANTYKSIGDYNRAYRYYKNANKIYIDLGAQREVALTNNSMGEIEREFGEYDKAINNHIKGIKYFKNKSKKQYLYSINELSADYLANNQYELSIQSSLKALQESYNKSLDYQLLKDSSYQEFNGLFNESHIRNVDEFTTFYNLANALFVLGKNEKVTTILNLLNNSSFKEEIFIDRKINFLILNAEFHLRMQEWGLFESYINSLLELITSNRNSFNVSDIALFWTHKFRKIINIYISYLIKNKRTDEAIEFLEETNSYNLRGKRFHKSNNINNRQNQNKSELEKFISLERQNILLNDGDLQIKADEAKESFYASNQIIKPEIIKLNSLSLPQIQKQLSSNELLLRYFISSEISLLFVIDNESFETITLPSENDINATIKGFLNDIKTKNFKALLNSKNLFFELLPKDKLLSQKYKKLIIVPDGITNLLPFSSININQGDEYTSLISKFEVERTYSASDYFSSVNTINSKKDSISILSNPLFLKNANNPQLEAKYSNENKLWEFEPLPYSNSESNLIEEIFPQFELNLLSGNRATNKNFLSEKTRNSNIIHVATHGFFNDESLENVGLATSIVDENGDIAPGVLALRELLYESFESNLVVLSGCETTLGKQISGEGFNSLSRGFLSQGVNSVIGTIWSISDRATPIFMKEFYTNLKQMNGNVSKALNTTKSKFSQSPEFRRYRHPYYWAGFVLTSANKQISENIFLN